MSAEHEIQKLLTVKAELADNVLESWARQAARVAWGRERIEALRAAQQKADEAWARLLAPIPDHVPDEELEGLPEPPEQAQLDAIHAEIQAVIDHDRWPRHLHFSGI